jgi:predicted ATP-grasp superfamily ATP-dependent carboligase
MKYGKKSFTMPFAIVIGLDSMQGLQTARILAKRGVPVVGIAKDPKYYACQTRVCKDIIYTNTENNELIKILIQLGEKIEKRGVLFPCQDINVFLISKYRDELKEYYHVILPNHDVVKMLSNKLSFCSYALENKLPIPSTFIIRNYEEAKSAALKLVYPAVLKPPLRSPKWLQNTSEKAFKIFNDNEFISIYHQYRSLSDVMIAQEWIEGLDENLYSCNCYFNKNCEPIVTFTARKIRQWPPITGQSSMGEECRSEVVLKETLRLFSGVGYVGLGYLEMKKDNKSGKYFIIEPNIGRPTGRSAIAEAGGVELVYTMYCDALGMAIPRNIEQKYSGVKWIHILRDLQSAFYYWRSKELNIRDWLKSLRGKKAYAIFSLTDPLPFIRAASQALLIVMTGLRKIN